MEKKSCEEILESGGVLHSGVYNLGSLEIQPLLENLDEAVLASEGDGDAPDRGCYEVLLARENVIPVPCPVEIRNNQVKYNTSSNRAAQITIK